MNMTGTTTSSSEVPKIRKIKDIMYTLKYHLFDKFIYKFKKSNTASKAEHEINILEKTVKDAIIVPFKKEILALVDAFGKSGQSGGSAPYTAGAISKAVENLCLQKPLGGVTGIDEEWVDVSEYFEGNNELVVTYQNNRLSSVFKKVNKTTGKERSSYIDAIVFKGDNTGGFTSSMVFLPSGGSVGSSLTIKEFPFEPKTFYIDVIETEWADKDEKVKKEGGGWWTSVVKDEKQLEEVWKYYEKPDTV